MRSHSNAVSPVYEPFYDVLQCNYRLSAVALVYIVLSSRNCLLTLNKDYLSLQICTATMQHLLLIECSYFFAAFCCFAAYNVNSLLHELL